MKKRFLAVLLALVLAVGMVPTAAAGGYVPSLYLDNRSLEHNFWNCEGSWTEAFNDDNRMGLSISNVADSSFIADIAFVRLWGDKFIGTIDAPNHASLYGTDENGSGRNVRGELTIEGDRLVLKLENQHNFYFDSSLSEFLGGERFVLQRGNTATNTYRDFDIEYGVLVRYKGSGGAVTIPDGIIGIGAWAFDSCTDLISVTIPNSVTSIGENTFRNCTNLTTIQVNTNHPHYTLVDGVLFTKDMKTLEIYPGGKQGSYTIPNGVTRIAGCAFSGCTSLTSVTIPNSVTYIGGSAFRDCTGLKDVYYAGTKDQWKAIEILEIGTFGDIGGNDPLLNATIHYNSTAPAQPKTAVPSGDKLTVDGVAKVPTSYKIGGANYFKLRDVAMLMNGTKGQFSVDYNDATGEIHITTGQPYQPNGKELKGTPTTSATANATDNPLYINGVKVDLPVYKIGGANYFKIRELCKALGFNVGYSNDRGMYIESDKPYTDAD